MNRRMRYALLKCYAKIDGNYCRTHFKIVIVFGNKKGQLQRSCPFE